jgi:O-antigen ligase
MRAQERESGLTGTGKMLLVLCAFIFIALPFAEWPGTALRTGIPSFIKAAVFYLFTVNLVRSERQLKLFMFVFIACQTIRILEPLYLHYSEGYWGGITTMELNRLGGGPYDVINPNGLAELIASIIPFYYCIAAASGWRFRLLLYGLIPPSINALILTGSRSGLIALVVVIGGIILKSGQKILLIVIVAACVLAVAGSLSDTQKDRYQSITDRDNERFGHSAENRVAGSIRSFMSGFDRPIFGHGLGTSPEVNYHKVGYAARSHMLYAEIIQELGIFGLIIFVMYIRRIIINIRNAIRFARTNPNESPYLINLAYALEIWFWMLVVFSFASYGLLTYQWYLLGGMSVVLAQLIANSGYHREFVTDG